MSLSAQLRRFQVLDIHPALLPYDEDPVRLIPAVTDFLSRAFLSIAPSPRPSLSEELGYLGPLFRCVMDRTVELHQRIAALEIVLRLLRLARGNRNRTFQNALGYCLDGSPFSDFLHRAAESSGIHSSLISSVLREIDDLRFSSDRVASTRIPCP